MRENRDLVAEESGPTSSFMVIGGDGAEDDGGQRHFVRALDSKLRRLQRHRGGVGKQHASRKPIFVTTVKTGIFLDPPPDLAALLGLDGRHSSSSAPESDRFYSYSSEPRVLYDKRHQRASAAATSCRKANRQRPDVGKQMGYTNIMHDKRVVRGSNFAKKTFRPKWNPYFGYAKQLSAEPGKESPADREAEVRRRTMARKKAMDYQTKALRLHLETPKLTRNCQNVDIQTDSCLEELYPEYPPNQTFGAQTEFGGVSFSNSRTATSVGSDACTQVDEKDLFDFDIEVSPIAENLISDAFKEAMLEVLYEDELETRARQQRMLYLRRSIEDSDKKRLEHEDERLNKVMDCHAQLFDEDEENEKSRVSALTSDRVTELLPEELKNQKSEEIVSWLVQKLQDKHTESDEILKSMIHKLVKNRLDVYDKVVDVQSIPKPEELFKEIESVTSQPDQKNDSENL